MDEHNPYASPTNAPKPVVTIPVPRLGQADQPPARPTFRVLAIIIAAGGLTTLFFHDRTDFVGLLVMSWFILEMAWIGFTGYGLYFGRRIAKRTALDKSKRLN
jgi:hypothetical protein